MVRNQFGERQFEERTFEMKYNPTIENYALRILAKSIDYLIFIIITILLYSLFNYHFRTKIEIMLAGLMLLFIINSIFESKFGKTIGKYIIKVQVIDDYGQTPTLFLSFKRNFFTLGLFLANFQILPRRLNLGADIHNKICKTYVIYDKDLAQIRLYIAKESAIER